MINKIIKYGLYLFIFLLPWQTRWIYLDFKINGEALEYMRWSLYGTEIILILILFLGLGSWAVRFLKLTGEEREQEIRNDSRGVRFLIYLMAVWTLFSVLWSIDRGLAWYGWIKLVEGIGLYWLITQSFRINKKTAVSLPNLGNIVIASGLVQALFGIYQFLGQKNFVANKWLGLSALDITQPGASVIEFLDQRWIRAYGSLSHPNILGGFLAICLLILIINLWQYNRRVTDFKQAAGLNNYYWISAIIIFTGLIMTFSRSAWMAFGASFVAGFVFHLAKKNKKIIKLNFALLIMFCLVFGVVWTVFPTELFTTRFNFNARLEKQSIYQRTLAYQQADELTKEHSFRGLGKNNYIVALYYNNTGKPAWFYQPVHNLWYLTYAELGWPGVILFIFIFLAALRRKNAYIMPVMALLILSFFDHYLISFYFGIIVWWLVIGMSIKSIKSNE